jgi:hypothetical protein
MPRKEVLKKFYLSHCYNRSVHPCRATTQHIPELMCHRAPVHPVPLKKDDDEENGKDQETQQSATVQWTLPSCPQKNVVNTYTRCPRVKKAINHHT